LKRFHKNKIDSKWGFKPPSLREVARSAGGSKRGLPICVDESSALPLSATHFTLHKHGGDTTPPVGFADIPLKEGDLSPLL